MTKNYKKGTERNKSKLLCGVALCDAPTVDALGNRLREYIVWKDMVKRVYSRNTEKDRKKYRNYNNVTICERWLTFSNFLEDLPLIEGYEEWVKGEVKMSLDKDMKQQGVENKVYSLETCIFISQGENARISQVKPMISIDMNDYNNKQYHYNVRQEFGNSSGNIAACAKGRQNSYHGQRWFYAETYHQMCDEIDSKFQALEESKIALSWREIQDLYNLIMSANFLKLNQELDKIK